MKPFLSLHLPLLTYYPPVLPLKRLYSFPDRYMCVCVCVYLAKQRRRSSREWTTSTPSLRNSFSKELLWKKIELWYFHSHSNLPPLSLPLLNKSHFQKSTMYINIYIVVENIQLRLNSPVYIISASSFDYHRATCGILPIRPISQRRLQKAIKHCARQAECRIIAYA